MNRDLYKYFRIEARELFEALQQGVLDLSAPTPDPDTFARLLRHAHTLKGAARVVKLGEIGELAHDIEEALGQARSAGSTLHEGAITHLLGLVDAVGERLSRLESETKPTRAAEQQASAAAAQPEELLHTVRVDLGEMDSLLGAIVQAGVQANALRSQVVAVEQASFVARVLSQQLARPADDRREAALARVRELTEQLRQSMDRIRRDLAVGVDQTEVEIAQVRDAADRLRLLPVSAVFGALQRAVRDAGVALGRQVAFESTGGDVRMDAHVISALREALLHVVRNAVAHGIEPASEREATGKSAMGRVTLRVTQRGHRVVFECQDDGKGMDLTALRAAAVAGGAMSAEQAADLDEQETIALSLRPGVSTSGLVTELSGRGIGLDVVAHTVRQLNGELQISSAAGRGTTLRIDVPISLASLALLRVEAAGHIALLPLHAVKRTQLVRVETLARAGSALAVSSDDGAIPFVSLASILGLPSPARDRTRRTWCTVIVQTAWGAAAVGVDRLLGTSEQVVRRIPEMLHAAPVVAGASLDPEGNPVLVIDPAGLVAAAAADRHAPPEAPRPRLPVLIIDDSLTTRMLEQSILESAGYAVDVASSAEEALEKARAKRFGMFVVDVEMPGMDGFEFLRTVGANPALRDVPSILVTSRTSQQDRARGEEVGARAYIVKSEFDQGFLLETIRRWVG